MPRPTASPDLIASHYTRVSGTDEAVNRASKAPWARPDAPTQPKETTMFRTFMTAAILALTVTAAQAGDVTIHVGDLDLTRAQDTQMLASRVQAAAKTACTLEFGTHTGAITYNNAVIQSCVKQASKSAMTKYQTMAKGTAVAHSQIAGK